jgi:glycosyltransferase involved in cell wall biosynthesis
MLSRLAPSTRGVARVWTALHGRAERRAILEVDRMAGISETVHARIRQYYGRPAEVIYPPVATSRYRFTELGKAWLSVSRLYPEKRIDLLFDVFRRLPSERLILVGGHAPGDRARRYLERLDPPRNVTILGPVPEERLLDLYARCRGFITAAVDEDFGLTPVEAMASGKCVLATDEGGYRETIQPGRTGFLLPPNPDSFVEMIRELDESRLLSMRDDCIRRSQAFDESVFLKKMKLLIEWNASPGE